MVKYARTPVMSTYLLAFVVGEYDYVEDKDKDGVLVRVYTPKGKAVQGKFALEVNRSVGLRGFSILQHFFITRTKLYNLPLQQSTVDIGRHQSRHCHDIP